MARKDRTLGIKLKAIDRMSQTIDRVKKKFPQLSRAVMKASKVTQMFNARTKRMRALLTKVGGSLKNFGRGMTTFVTLPLVAAAGASLKFFGDFEQGLKGIEKTTGISGPALEKLGKTFDQLSTDIPVTTKEMLTLAQAGGQLGIRGVKDLEKFTIVMAELSRTSDVAGADGAKAIARILKVTDEGIGNIDRFTSALVALGNNAAAGELEILGMSTRVAGLIGRFDVGSASVLGIATALKELGKKAESAGSVVGRSFDAIDQAIQGGKTKTAFKFLSRLTGIAGKDLKKAFKDDAAKVFQRFVEGLSKVEKGGGNLVKVMGVLGLAGVKVNDVLGTLAKRPEVLAVNMALSAKAFKENTARQKEFAIQTKSFNSAMIRLTNTFTSLLRMIGAELAPAVLFFAKIIKGVLNFLRDSPALRTFAIALGAIVAVMGPLVFILGVFLTILPALMAGAAGLGIGLLPLAGIVIGVTLAIAGLIAIGVTVVSNWDAIRQAFATNPFLKAIVFIGAMVEALGKLFALLAFTLANFRNLSAIGGAFKDVFNFGGDDHKPGLGASVGARPAAKGLGQGPLRDQQSVNGDINVNFANLPAGSNVQAKTEGPLDFNLGFVGGLQ